MDKQLIERIALEVAANVMGLEGDEAFIEATPEEIVSICTSFLSRIDAERGKEAVAWFALADNNGPVPLELWGFDKKACKHAVLENARSVGWKGTIEGYLLHMGWTIRPLFLSPTIPEGMALVPTNSTEASLQAKIDELMLEYCPDEMTAEQLEEWGRNQRPVTAEETWEAIAAQGERNAD